MKVRIGAAGVPVMFHSSRPYWPFVAEPGAVNTTCVPDGYVTDGTGPAGR